ncbi:biliverdin-producing heme oxygenase [Nocardioides alcanivorans]|uniref:biliverdin-producing heme oxygenase n=1 Tax=Nocardioides alcanivorans TaxID=2897352 RepID=UPI001F3DC1A9|nr:biliverdin-producing heme oxygenase [Nocardioides alcanivorans]
MTALDTAPTTTPLSVAMREGSMSEHEQAEHAGFTTDLMAGKINALGYLHYLEGLRTVYRALEKVGRELATTSPVDGIHDTQLERSSALDADIDYWAARAGVAAGSHSSPAAEAYAARIEATVDNPARYAAHHYTRYLGDLSGGLAIGRILARTYELDADGEGLSFYRFEQIEKPKVYKDGYRAALDALPVTAEQRDEIVTEVKAAFGCNQAFFVELGENLAAYQR